ncbi:MAG: caspase family protein, partial [Longimicrobiales bacterium]
MSSKSCPGTAIKRSDVLLAIKDAHLRVSAPRAARTGAFDDSASRERAATDRVLQLFNVDTRPRALGEEGELSESAMTVVEAAMSAGEPGAFAAARGGDTRELSAEDRALLRRHVINLRMGAFSSAGEFQTSQEDVLALFAEHLPTFLADRKREGGSLQLVFFAHGGLNDEIESLKNARNRIPFYLANKCYPIFFVWETGVQETLVDILREIVGLAPSRAILGAITDFSDAGLERAFRNGGFSMWANMKLSAERAFLPRQGGTFLVQQLADFWRQHNAEMSIHTIGHSAGSIFLAHFIDLLCQQASNPPIEVQSLHFLAPAITVDLFKEKLMPLVGGRVKRLTEFTMLRDFEQADSVGPYRKSLLYLVSRSFEDASEMPILGLEESIRRDPDLVRFFGLLGNKRGRGEILFSVQDAGPSQSTIAKKHGDFDNDRRTMSSVIRRILEVADDVPIVEFAETVSRNVLSMAAPPGAAPAVSLTAAPVPPVSAVVPPAGRRRAICVGIDDYDPPNQLAGCVNDANDWSAALKGLGFEVDVVRNRDATWKAICDALTGLVASSRSGDVLVFQYAGHGTHLADLDGDEPGGRDSALCPVDFPSGGCLIDDDVRRIFGHLPAGVNLTCFFDCCHS